MKVPILGYGSILLSHIGDLILLKVLPSVKDHGTSYPDPLTTKASGPLKYRSRRAV